MPVIIEFSRCIGTYSSAKFELIIFLIILGKLIYNENEKKYNKSDYAKCTNISYTSCVNNQNKGAYGEFRVYQLLSYIKGNKRFLLNCYLPTEKNGTSEVDLIMIHESGIYVIESKNLCGWIFGSENSPQWTQSLCNAKGTSTKYSFTNPVMQNKTHIKWLKKLLLDYDRVPIYSIIIFSNQCEFKKINLLSHDHHIIKLNQLFNKTQELILQSTCVMPPATIEVIYHRLFPYTQVTNEQKQAHITNIKQKYHSR